MNINCPKCGFTQPQDQYCARCGVDITTYKAPAQPLMKQIVGSLLFQLMLVFFVGGSAVYWVHQNSVKKTRARIEFLKGSSLQVQASAARNQFEQQQPTTAETSAEFTDMSSRSLAPGKPQATEKTKAEVSIQFLQVPEATLNLWLQEEILTRVETSDNLLMGYILDLNKIMTTAQYQVKVLKSENFALATEQIYTTKLTFPKSTDDSQIRNLASQLGVSAFATLDSMTEESVAGQLEVSMDQQNSFPIQFEMNPNSAVILTGFSRLKGMEKTPDSELIVVLSLKK